MPPLGMGTIAAKGAGACVTALQRQEMVGRRCKLSPCPHKTSLGFPRRVCSFSSVPAGISHPNRAQQHGKHDAKGMLGQSRGCSCPGGQDLGFLFGSSGIQGARSISISAVGFGTKGAL